MNRDVLSQQAELCTYSAQLQVSSVCFWWGFYIWGHLARVRGARTRSAKEDMITCLDIDDCHPNEINSKRHCESEDQDIRRFTGKFSRGCLRRKSPKISSQYLAILYCCGLLVIDTYKECINYMYVLKKKIAKSLCVHFWLYIPAMVFKGQNNRVFWCDKCCLLDGLNNILLEERWEKDKYEKEKKEEVGTYVISYCQHKGADIPYEISCKKAAVADNSGTVMLCVHALTLNRMSVHMALPWVMMGSWSSPFPSQQSSSTHLTGGTAHSIIIHFTCRIEDSLSLAT